jgi:hypothetical protein
MGSKSFSVAQDQRTIFGSGSGLQIAPGGAFISPGGGSVTASGAARVSQAITYSPVGMTGDDVAQLLGMIDEDRASERAAITGVAQSLASGLMAQSEQTAETLAAAQVPEATTLKQLMPLLLLLAVGYFLLR